MEFVFLYFLRILARPFLILLSSDALINLASFSISAYAIDPLISASNNLLSMSIEAEKDCASSLMPESNLPPQSGFTFFFSHSLNLSFLLSV